MNRILNWRPTGQKIIEMEIRKSVSNVPIWMLKYGVVLLNVPGITPADGKQEVLDHLFKSQTQEKVSALVEYCKSKMSDFGKTRKKMYSIFQRLLSLQSYFRRGLVAAALEDERVRFIYREVIKKHSGADKWLVVRVYRHKATDLPILKLLLTKTQSAQEQDAASALLLLESTQHPESADETTAASPAELILKRKEAARDKKRLLIKDEDRKATRIYLILNILKQKYKKNKLPTAKDMLKIPKKVKSWAKRQARNLETRLYVIAPDRESYLEMRTNGTHIANAYRYINTPPFPKK